MKSITPSLAACALALVHFSALSQTEQYFLKVDGVDGESTDSRHLKEIVVLGFNLTATNIGSYAYGTGAGKARFDDLVVRKPVDKSSPILCQAAGSGQAFKSMVLSASMSVKGAATDVYVITFDNCYVRGFSTSGDTDPASPYPLTETISIGYSKVEWSYKTSNIRAGWDLGGNKKFVVTQSNADSNAPIQAPEAAVAVAPLGVTQKAITRNVNVARQDAGNVSLSFEAEAGKAYRILGSATANGPYDFLQIYSATETKAVALSLSATQAVQFFRVEEAQ